MKKIIILIIGIALSLQLAASNDKNTNTAINTVEVSGKIIDSETGEALTGVKVYIEDFKTETYTDFDGKFKLNIQNTKEITVTVSYISYKDKKIKAVIEDMKNLTVSLDMLEE